MKKLLVLMTFLGLAFSLFAQDAKATGLSDKDVDSVKTIKASTMQWINLA